MKSTWLIIVAVCIAASTCVDMAWAQDAGAVAAAGSAVVADPISGNTPPGPLASEVVEHWISIGLQALGGLTLLMTALATFLKRAWRLTSLAAKFGWDLKGVNKHEPEPVVK